LTGETIICSVDNCSLTPKLIRKPYFVVET